MGYGSMHSMNQRIKENQKKLKKNGMFNRDKKLSDTMGKETVSSKTKISDKDASDELLNEIQKKKKAEKRRMLVYLLLSLGIATFMVLWFFNKEVFH